MRESKGLNLRRVGWSILIFFVVMETGLRIGDYWLRGTPFFDARRYIADDGQIWKPNPGYKGPLASISEVSVNSWGVIGPGIKIPAAENTLRIIIAGCSITLGVGVSKYEDTLPVQLQKALSPALPERKVEVLNHSIPGHSSYNGRKFVETELEKFGADYLIIAYGWNDLSLDILPDKSPGKNWQPHDISSPEIMRFCRTIMYFEKFRQRASLVYKIRQVHKRRDLCRRVAIEDFRENIRVIQKECKKNGVTPILLTLPVRPGIYDRFLNTTKDLHNEYMEFKRSYAREENLILVDADSLISFADSPNDYFVESRSDIMHLNNSGQKYITELIAGEILIREKR